MDSASKQTSADARPANATRKRRPRIIYSLVAKALAELEVIERGFEAIQLLESIMHENTQTFFNTAAKQEFIAIRGMLLRHQSLAYEKLMCSGMFVTDDKLKASVVEIAANKLQKIHVSSVLYRAPDTTRHLREEIQSAIADMDMTKQVEERLTKPLED